MREATDKLLAEYEQAQSIGQHSDVVLHEIAAIAWGANTLLLGFILEVACDSPNQRLVIVASIIGFLISAFVPFAQYLVKIGQTIAFDVCRKIENDLPLPHRLNNQIHDKYPQKWGRYAVWVITVFFVLAWCGVIWNAVHCLSNSSAAKQGLANVDTQQHPLSTSVGTSIIHLDLVNTGI